MRLIPLNLWIFLTFSIKKLSKIFKTGSHVEPPVFRFLPVHDRFSDLITDSPTGRFCVQLGPDFGLVPGPAGRTGRSGPIFTTLKIGK
jgi:hypothetical protein